MGQRLPRLAAALALASITAVTSPTPSEARNGRWVAAGVGLLAAGLIASALAPRYGYYGGPYAAYAYAPGYGYSPGYAGYAYAPGYVGYGYAPYYGYGYYGRSCVFPGAYRPDYSNC